MDLRLVWLYALVAQCVLFSVTQSKKILMLPYPAWSHVAAIQAIGDELLERGHQVHIVTAPSMPGLDKIQSRTNVTFATWRMAEPDYYTAFGDEVFSPDLMEEAIRMTMLEDITTNVDPVFPLLSTCSNPLSDNRLFDELSDAKFDLAIVDALMVYRCIYILPYRLGIPFVSITTQYEPWQQRNPALPSFVPFPIGTGDFGYTEQMTFPQRLYNLYILIRYTAFIELAVMSDELVTKYAPDKPFRSLQSLAQQSLLWLMDTDHVIDYARPLMTNMVEVGGLTTKPALPLPSPLHDFMEEAEHGVIVISFGSLGASLPNRLNDHFFEAFSRIRQRLVWKFIGDRPEEYSENIMLTPWIPQNDVLGHPKVRLFITHCGANGQFEGLYHGIPMIGMPLYADQPYNAARIVYNGIGLWLNLLDFTADTLEEAINKVLTNSSYSEKVRHLSKIFRSRKESPVGRAASWIEHIMEYGGEHMHSYAVDMPWYQYIMLDILVFMVTLLGLGVLTSFLLLRFIYKILVRSRQKVKQN